MSWITRVVRIPPSDPSYSVRVVVVVVTASLSPSTSYHDRELRKVWAPPIVRRRSMRP